MSESAPYKFDIKTGGTPAPGDGSVKEALQVFRLKTKDVTAAIAVAQPDLAVSDLKWAEVEFEHGSEIELSAKIANHDGLPLKFVVETDASGSWQPYAEVPGKVSNGVVKGTLRAHHPVLPPTGATPSTAKLKEAKPAGLRFSLERGEAQPQPKADPQPEVKASATPKPATDVGALEITGALPNEPFFLIDAKSGQPVRANPKGLVRTDAQSVNGVMFFLSADKTARFDGLPEGKYRVVFPPDQSEDGNVPPKIRANSEGAHVVDVKDFAKNGADCQIEVAKDATAKVQVTVGADGVAHVCC